MSDDRIPAKLNQVDKSAFEALSDTVSIVGDECDIIIVLKNKQDDHMTISSNCSHKDGFWYLSQARHFVLMASMSPSEEDDSEGEEGEDSAVDPETS